MLGVQGRVRRQARHVDRLRHPREGVDSAGSRHLDAQPARGEQRRPPRAPGQPRLVLPALIVFSLISSNSNDIHNRYFLPSHNPDGYHKSQEEDRMWRKTTTHYDNDLCQVLELYIFFYLIYLDICQLGQSSLNKSD